MTNQTGGRVYEHIITLTANAATYNPMQVRMWCATEQLDHKIMIAQRAQILNALAGVKLTDSWIDVAELLSRLSFCNAVEVVASNGGGLIYPTWP